MNRHLNIDVCSKCEEIMQGCKSELLLNFYKQFRKDRPDAHISCCYRGKDEQEVAFNTGHSKAHFGQSAHNYGLAIDVFRITQAGGAEFDAVWYKNFLQPACIAAGFTWGGNFSFRDLPHVECSNWKELAKDASP